MIAPARVAAYEVGQAVASGRSDLPAAIARARGTLADDRDRALAAEIATGVERWRAALDHLIVHFARRPIARLDPEIVAILRLSVYQLLHLTRVPAAAVVDDAVDLAGRAGKRSAGGLVNAVLRAIARGRGRLPLPPRPADPGDRAGALAYGSITLSHPEWLVARWLDRYGFDATERRLEFDNAPAPLTLRANRLRTTVEELRARLAADEVEASPGRYAPDALVVAHGHSARGADHGLFVVQDEASQLVALLAGRRPGPRVLDTCASPGGKTTALAAAMGDRGLLVACDVRDRRIDLLRRTVATSGASNVRIAQADLLARLPFSARFDTVLVDAPCSGLGILRRDPDIRWRRREDDLPSLAAAQLVMLQHAAEAVDAGGRLVYATCSSEPEENEGVASAFLATSPAFAAVDLAADDNDVPREVIDARGHLRTSPHEHGLEAFFGAVFVRSTTYSTEAAETTEK
jgi:16S rRNA (cytosine967-C5)-methyltransferase